MRDRDGGTVGGRSVCGAMLLAVFGAMVFLSAPVYAQDVDVDESTNGSFNSDVTIDAQSQRCVAIVRQFNNAVGGDAVAIGEGAVAETAAAVDAPVSVVRSCLQANGDVVIGSGDGDGNDDGNDVRTTEDESVGQEETDDGAVRADENTTSAGQQQYDDTRANTSGQAEDSCAVALDPRVTVAENGVGEETLNVESGQEGDYRITYDLGDETDSLEITLTSAGSGSAVAPLTVDEDGSRIVDLSEGSYEITVTPESEDGDEEGGYTVEVSRCGPSSDDPDNTMDDTYDSGKQLANTGGPTVTSAFASPSAVLIPFGAALLVCGVVAAAYLRNASAGR